MSATSSATYCRARLCVEFPKTTLPRSLSVHRRHLAAGFSNGKDTAYPVHIDPSVGLGVSERTKLFSDGGVYQESGVVRLFGLPVLRWADRPTLVRR